MIVRFTLFGREVFAVDLQWPDFGAPALEGEFDEPEERIRLGVNVELADDEPAVEDRSSCRRTASARPRPTRR
jgi:hypothetical protein